MSEKTATPIPGGDLELSLLTALWNREDGRATVRELHEEVGTSRGIVYTTVAKVLDRLVEKGMVERQRAGRAYVYHARVERAATQRAIARNLIERLAGDTPRPAVAALVGALEEVSPDLLDDLAAELRARKAAVDGT